MGGEARGLKHGPQWRSSPEPSMDWRAIHGPASCSSHADMGAHVTSLMDVGRTVYCGVGSLPAAAPSSPSGPCSWSSLAEKSPLRCLIFCFGGGACNSETFMS